MANRLYRLEVLPMMRWLCLAALLVHMVLGLCGTPPARAQDVPVVAAAADLQFALAEAAQAFTKETKRAVTLAFGSSGNFFRQIQQGGPFQMFLSADEQFVLDLAAKGLTEGDGALYAVGRMVIIAPHGSPLKVDSELVDLKAALADGRLKKFAIANPEHAPYGRRGEEALRHIGVWEEIKDRLVFGENVAQAAQFATSGATQGGIIAYSLVLSPNVSKLGRFALIPEQWHQPLNQRMVLLKGAGATARSFYEFMRGPSARVIMRRYGFVLPGESS
jgi:molybdate transport system substrate-binding protein